MERNSAEDAAVAGEGIEAQGDPGGVANESWTLIWQKDEYHGI